ncbi:MAG TPA: UDP-N-acetylmuramate--alanine ligase [Burkholderiales bacterium]|nr:UDP-N-acetylmuramate--alanine ligase [Burkholderiales bacterium]
MPRLLAPKRQQLRQHIAYVAARLMAEDGIVDFALAKRKAARQTGVSRVHELPTNEEVEQALRAYQELYQSQEQRAVLRQLRKQAISVMQLLASFNPHLTGSVLSGTASKHSEVSLQVFVDSVKDVELFLLNNQISYRRAEKRMYVGDACRVIPVFTLDKDEANVTIAVFSTDDQRHPLRTSLDGKPMERASTNILESLLQQV